MSDGNANRVALVTGSSTGIGAAIALELAKRGFRLIVHGRSNSKNLEDVQKKLNETGCPTKTVVFDFSDTGGLQSFSDKCWDQFGSVDVLVNNAGGDVLTGDWAEQEFETKLDYLLNVDVKATLLLSRSFGQRMVQAAVDQNRPSGTYAIVNMGWDQAFQGMAGESGEMFATTKGAIMCMTKSLAQSFAPAVRINCIAPGWIRTEWGASANEQWNRRAIGEALMNRWGTPTDVAKAVAFLCSQDASFISGQILPVNGGYKYFQQER